MSFIHSFNNCSVPRRFQAFNKCWVYRMRTEAHGPHRRWLLGHSMVSRREQFSATDQETSMPLNPGSTWEAHQVGREDGVGPSSAWTESGVRGQWTGRQRSKRAKGEERRSEYFQSVWLGCIQCGVARNEAREVSRGSCEEATELKHSLKTEKTEEL